VVPMQDADGEMHSLQKIDDAGEKLFLPGGRKHGCFYPIGNLATSPTIFVAEGFATAASIHEATAAATLVAFDCGNLKPVAVALRNRYRNARIVICADDDAQTAANPGVTHASEAAKAVDAMVAIPKFDPHRGAGQTDFNDIHKANGIATVKAQLARFLRPTFSSLPVRLVGEAKERVERGHHTLRFGVDFLDHCLGGITRTDLILIGAKTGVGKTSLATAITTANCMAGKRVHYFALEAEDKEIERRMKYKLIADAYYAQPGGHRPICYLDWLMGKIEDEVAEFNDEADEKLSAACKSLHTYYKDDSFTSDDFADHFDAIQDDTDLAILDLFSEVDSDDENENRAAKKIIARIRNASLRAQKPVVIVGHIRKTDPRFSPLVPGEEDFHGSSALIKAVTKGIMLAPDYETQTGDPMLWSTFIKAVKCRPESARTRYCAKMRFDVRKDSYQPAYVLGRLTNGGKKWEELDQAQVPAWSANPRELPVDTIPMEDDG
jgi:Toprim domain/AAA domain